MVPAKLIGTIDFYYSVPLLLTFTLPWGHKVNTKQTSWFHFLAHFSTDQHEIKYDVEAIEVEHPYIIVSFNETRKINGFTDCIKQF